MIQVTARVHPFAPAKRDIREYPEGTSIQNIVSDLVPVEVGRVIVMVDGEECKDRETIPADGSLVTVSVVPAGSAEEMSTASDKTGGWSILLGFGLFITGVLTANPMLAYAGIGLFIVGGITAAGLGMASSIMKGMASSSTETTLSIAGGRNTLAPWGKVPIVIGKHRLSPHYAAGAWTYVDGTDGEDQYLKQIFCLGRNTLKVTDIKLGENLLASNSADVRNGSITVDGLYSNVTVQLYQNGTAPSEYPSLVTQDEVGAALKYNSVVWKTSAKNTTTLVAAVNVAGLYKIVNGSRSDHTVTVEARYRVAGSGTAWASCPVLGSLNVTRARAKLLRFEIGNTVSEGQYEVGVMRTSADDPEDFDGASETTWAALRSHRNVPVVSEKMREKVVLLAVTIKATDQLNGAIDNLNAICESVEHVYSGGNWNSTAASRNPAAHIIEGMVHGRFLNDPVPTEKIDWAAFNAWYALCATKGWNCDKVVADSSTLQDLCNRIAHTGRAYITLRDGMYSPVVDEAKTTIVQHFTPRNVKSFTWTKAFSDLPHGFRVGFLSADDDFQTSERLCLYDEYTEETATKLERQDLWGITGASHAWKHGRYLLACRRLRPEAYTFETDIESIVCEPGDLVLVSHDSIAVGIVSGRIKGLVTGGGGVITAIDIDETVTTEVGKTYGVQIRAVSGNYYRTVTVSGKRLTLSSSLPALALDIDDLYTFGESGTETMRCIVSSIETGQDFGARVTCLDEAPGVHTADAGTIPAYTPLVGRKGQDTALDVDVRAAIVDLRGQIEDRPTSETLSTAPATVASLTARAVQDGIILGAVPGGSPGLDNSAAYYRYQVSRDGGLTWPGDWAAAAQTEYRFNRDTDGYPDSVSLYRARVKAVSSAGVESVNWLSVTVDGTGYLGWTPGTPGLSGAADNRAAELRLVQASGYYGHSRYEIQIQKSGDASWYAPGDSGAARDSETAYRGTVDEWATAYGSTFAQTLPLTNQAAGLPVNTSYLYRIRAVVAKPTTAAPDAVSRSSWTSAITVIAKPTGTVDLVAKAVKAAQLDEKAVTVEKLNVLAKNLVNDLTDDADGTTGWTLNAAATVEVDATIGRRALNMPAVTHANHATVFEIGPNNIIEVDVALRAITASTYASLRLGIDGGTTLQYATWNNTTKSWGAFGSNVTYRDLSITAVTASYTAIKSYIVGQNVQPSDIPAPVNAAECVRVVSSPTVGIDLVVFGTTSRVYAFAPSARKVGSGKIVAQQIVTPNIAAISAKLGEIKGDTADYKLVMGSGGSADEGTLLLGAETDASYFRRWKDGGVWKMAIKLATLFVDAVSSKILGIFRVRNSADTSTVFEVDPTTGKMDHDGGRLYRFRAYSATAGMYWMRVCKIGMNATSGNNRFHIRITGKAGWNWTNAPGHIDIDGSTNYYKSPAPNLCGVGGIARHFQGNSASTLTGKIADDTRVDICSSVYFVQQPGYNRQEVDVYLRWDTAQQYLSFLIEVVLDYAGGESVTKYGTFTATDPTTAATDYYKLPMRRVIEESPAGLTTLADVTANSLAVSGSVGAASLGVSGNAQVGSLNGATPGAGGLELLGRGADLFTTQTGIPTISTVQTISKGIVREFSHFITAYYFPANTAGLKGDVFTRLTAELGLGVGDEVQCFGRYGVQGVASIRIKENMIELLDNRDQGLDNFYQNSLDAIKWPLSIAFFHALQN